MKTQQLKSIALLIICQFVLAIPFSLFALEKAVPEGGVRYGTAHISGQLDPEFLVNDSVMISFYWPNPFGLLNKYPFRELFPIEKDGSFSIETPSLVGPGLCVFGIGGMISQKGNGSVLYLQPGDLITVTGSWENDSLILNYQAHKGRWEIDEYGEVMDYFIGNHCDISSFAYLDSLQKDKKRLNLSPEMDKFLELQLDFLLLSSLSSSGNSSTATMVLSFLSRMDIGNPLGLSTYMYHEALSNLLVILDLPEIGETPVQEWLDSAKAQLCNSVPEDQTYFYSMLPAIAYYDYLYANTPFTPGQIREIRTFWNLDADSSALGRFLLEQNAILQKKLSTGKTVTICDVPVVPTEQVWPEILKRYQGKVVVVDVWATWCSPCLEAIWEITSLKAELKNENVDSYYTPNSLFNHTFITGSGIIT